MCVPKPKHLFMMRGREMRPSKYRRRWRSWSNMRQDEPLHLLCNEERQRDCVGQQHPKTGSLLCTACYISDWASWDLWPVRLDCKKDEWTARLNVSSPALYPLNDMAHSYEQFTFKDTSRYFKWKHSLGRRLIKTSREITQIGSTNEKIKVGSLKTA